MPESLTLPMHRRPIRGKPLVAVWGSLVVGSWVAAYLIARAIIWIARRVLS